MTHTRSWVPVQVPEELVVQIYALIVAEEEEGRPQNERPASTDLETFWSTELLGRAYRESPKSVKALLRTLVKRPEEDLTLEAFVEPVQEARGKNTNRRALAGVLGAFSRRAKNRYGAIQMPFNKHWDAGAKEVVYSMSATIAARLDNIIKEEEANR